MRHPPMIFPVHVFKTDAPLPSSRMRWGGGVFAAALFLAAESLPAHTVTFNATMSYAGSQPNGAVDAVANWTGAAFDAANIGGSGVNSDGGSNNGTTNDAYTYVANGNATQGQTFTTGSNANGYDVTSITVRMAGYTNNTATGANVTNWDLNARSSPILIGVGKVAGSTTFSPQIVQGFMAGGVGSPGSGSSANGPGTYITFQFASSLHLDPNTTYAFDVSVAGGTSYNSFEWLGTSADNYGGGTAYQRSGTTITPLTGDRVFMVNMTASASAPVAFSHPGTLHAAADFARMKAKVAAGANPWKADYDILAASPYAQTSWNPAPVTTILRGGNNGQNYTRSQQDAQAIYELGLRWQVTGNTTYADRAVVIANAWSSTLTGVSGDSNYALAAGICGYLFAIGGDVLSTYSGWAAADKQAYKDMMMRVFYTANYEFLWRHNNTPYSEGGNTHYRLNWDTDNMASMAAIGVVCDNRAVYQQAIDYFKYGCGNGRIERAAWFVHPNGLAQGEEAGRDQPHNFDGWHAMALLCQTAWNQGDDLFGYDNSHVLRAFEYLAKYNLGYDVPYTPHRNTMLSYTEATIAAGGRGGFLPFFELIYNHYVNVKGIAAPYCKMVADQMRPEDRPHTEIHPSQVDWLGLGSLTYTRDPIASGVAPSGLSANWSNNQIVLSWWGTAYATSYNVKRAAKSGGPYTTLGTAGPLDTTFADTNVPDGATCYYVVSAVTPSGETADSPELAVSQSLVTAYSFENTLNDTVGARNGVGIGGSTGGPTFAAGKSGQALSLDGVDDCVQLPTGSGSYQDVTIAAWVYWTGSTTWQRVFDFGSEIEHYMMLTPKSSAGTIRFQITSTRGNESTVTLEGPAMPTNTWTHITVTINAGVATLYVNGLPVSASAGSIAPLFGQTFCYLGKSMWNSDPLFSGRIDDFRIYNYALSGAAVYGLWGGSSNHAPAFASHHLTRMSGTQGVSYASATQTLAGSATDTDGGTLTYSKVTGPSWLAVAANGTLSGTPTNADVGLDAFTVRVTDPSGATDDAALHISVINVNDAPVWSVSTITSNDITYGTAYSGSIAGFASDPDTPYGDTFTITKVSGPPWLSVSSAGVLSGTPGSGDVGTNSFTVRVTDAAGASADATLQIKVLGHVLRSRYPFNGDTSDLLGVNSGTATGSPSYVTGHYEQAISLDGSSSYVTLANPLPAPIYDQITVATWVYWNGGSNWQRIFDFGTGTSQYLFLCPSPDSTTLRFAIKNGGAEQQINTTILPAGQWVHVAVALGGGVGRLYVNGVLAATNSSITIKPSDFAPTLNYIGKSQFSADPLFNGLIDDFRIYNYALSASEIAALYAGPPPAPKGLGITAFPSGAVQLVWGSTALDRSYTISRSTTPGGSYTSLASGLANPNYVDSTAASGSTYYYVVSASNDFGDSANSIELALVGNMLAGTGFDAYSGAIVLRQGGLLAYDESSGTYVSGVTRASGLTVFGGPAFTVGPTSNEPGNLVIRGSASGATNDSFGPLNLAAGSLFVKLIPNSASNLVLAFDSLSRSSGTQLNFGHAGNFGGIGTSTIASSTTGTANVVFTTAPTSLLVGSGSSGTTSAPVLPCVFVSNNLTTYDSTYGLRGLNLSTEVAMLASGMTAGQNARITSGTVTLNANTTVNALLESGGTIAGAGTLAVTSGAIVCGVNSTIGNSTLAFGPAEGHINVANTRTLTINSVITGTGGLTVGLENYNATTANLVLGGANTYTGVTTLSGNSAAMKVKLTNGLALQNTTLDYNNYGASLQFGNGTTNVTNATLGGLAGTQNLALTNSGSGGGGVALTVGGDGDSTTYGGVLSGAGSLAKAGSGTLTLSGANTYTGTTTVSGGALNVTGSLAAGSAVTVSSGGTLAGTGRVNGTTTVSSGGILAPGNGGAGTLALGALTLGAGSGLSMELGTTSDVISVSGAYAASGTTGVNVIAATGFGAGSYALVTGASGISAGNFAVGNAPSGYSYALSASGGTLTLTVTAWTGIEIWRSSYFGTISNSGTAANSADADNDGRSNLLEYAVGSSPVTADSGPVANNGNDGAHLTLSFTRIPDATLTYVVEATNDLASGPWTTIWTSTGASNVSGSVTVTDTALMSASPSRFLRLRVTAP